MLYQEFPCHQHLNSLVDCFWAAESPPAGIKRVVPDGCIDIVFTIEETPKTQKAELRLVGPMTVPMLFPVQNPTTVLGVRFRPGGASALLRIPARELQDLCPPLEDAWGAQAQRMLQRLTSLQSAASRFSVLQDFLLSRLDPASSMDSALNALIREIEACDEPSPVESTARSYGFGPRRLRRAFDRWVGLSPKQFSRVMRFQRLLGRVHSGCPGNWAEQALECGYYDQPHMNREFRRLAGVAPSRYFGAV